MSNALGLERAAIAQQRIEDAGEAAGEVDDGHLFAAARRDAQGQVLSSSACGGRRRRMETAAWIRSQRVREWPALVIAPRRCVSPELYSRGTRPR